VAIKEEEEEDLQPIGNFVSIYIVEINLLTYLLMCLIGGWNECWRCWNASVTGGELLQRFVNEDNLTESEAAYYLRQLLLAVEYMHSRNVIHLDLKVRNNKM